MKDTRQIRAAIVLGKYNTRQLRNYVKGKIRKAEGYANTVITSERTKYGLNTDSLSAR